MQGWVTFFMCCWEVNLTWGASLLHGSETMAKPATETYEKKPSPSRRPAHSILLQSPRIPAHNTKLFHRKRAPDGLVLKDEIGLGCSLAAHACHACVQFSGINIRTARYAWKTYNPSTEEEVKAEGTQISVACFSFLFSRQEPVLELAL